MGSLPRSLALLLIVCVHSLSGGGEASGKRHAVAAEVWPFGNTDLCVP